MGTKASVEGPWPTGDITISTWEGGNVTPGVRASGMERTCGLLDMVQARRAPRASSALQPCSVAHRWTSPGLHHHPVTSCALRTPALRRSRCTRPEAWMRQWGMCVGSPAAHATVSAASGPGGTAGQAGRGVREPGPLCERPSRGTSPLLTRAPWDAPGCSPPQGTGSSARRPEPEAPPRCARGRW